MNITLSLNQNFNNINNSIYLVSKYDYYVPYLPITEFERIEIEEREEDSLNDKKISIISTKLNQLSEHFEIYPSLSEKNPLEKILGTIEKIHYYISTYRDQFSKRELDTYRTQEHILEGSGSIPFVHLKAFSGALKDCELSNTGFSSAEILSFAISFFDAPDSMIEDAIRKFIPPLYEKLQTLYAYTTARSIQRKLESLEIGQSIWISVGTDKHEMMMRIEKKEDHYFDLFFSNTGMGTKTNSDFHPEFIHKDGTQNSRLIAQIENIPANTLLKGTFCQNFLHAKKTGENSEAAKKLLKESNDEGEKRINAIYGELRTLINEKSPLNANDDPRHWNHLQLTGSCGASCIWAMIRSVLKLDDFFILETYMQVQALAKSYALHKFNFDGSSIRKIMILDLVQSLQKNPLLKEKNKKILKSIRNDVAKSSKIKDPEMKISRSSKVNIEDYISQKDGKYELLPFLPIISSNKKEIATLTLLDRLQNPEENTLKAHLVMLKSDPYYSFQMKKEEESWRGVGYFDQVALLCFYIANGDQEQATSCIENLLERNLLAELEKGPDISIIYHIKQSGMDSILSNLVNQLSELDHTRSGITKVLFLSGLLIKQKCQNLGVNFQEIIKDLWQMNFNIKSQFPTYIKDLTDPKKEEYIKARGMANENTELIEMMYEQDQLLFEMACQSFIYAKYFYANLNAKKYLDEDNIWEKGLKALNIQQPELDIVDQ